MDDAPASMQCATCGAAASGWKCATCGAESAAHDANHACGGGECQRKCSGCGQAERNCSCATEPAAAPAVA